MRRPSMPSALAALFTTLGLLAGAPAEAEIYRWVDSAGHVHFGDQPPADVNRVRQLPNQALPEPADAARLRAVAEKQPVTLYLSNCGTPCDQAQAVLKERGIPYTTKFLDRDPEAVKAYRALAGQTLQVPSLRIGNNLQKGFEKGLWNNLLDLAGYPKPGGKATGQSGAKAP